MTAAKKGASKKKANNKNGQDAELPQVQEISLQDASTDQLKIAAYDIAERIQQLNNNLQAIQNEINRRASTNQGPK